MGVYSRNGTAGLVLTGRQYYALPKPTDNSMTLYQSNRQQDLVENGLVATFLGLRPFFGRVVTSSVVTLLPLMSLLFMVLYDYSLTQCILLFG